MTPLKMATIDTQCNTDFDQLSMANLIYCDFIISTETEKSWWYVKVLQGSGTMLWKDLGQV